MINVLQAGTSTPSPVGTRGRGRALALRGHAEALWREHIPLCIEVLLAPDCSAGCRGPLHLLERWTMSIYTKRWVLVITNIHSYSMVLLDIEY